MPNNSGAAAATETPQKSILLLGGSRHQVPAIEAAKRLGYRTVLADYLPDNPGQYVADVFYQESTVDQELMLKIARDEGVEGVLAFGTDVAAPTAAYIAEELGLAGNPRDAVDVLSTKNLFRAYLAENGFNCPQSASLPAASSVDDILALMGSMSLPVLLKPTDSSGSRGVTVLESADEQTVSEALDYARAFSRNGVLELEEFIQYGFPHLIGGDIFVVNGKVEFWGLMACLRNKDLAALVPAGKAFPAGLSDEQFEAVKEEVQKLITSLGFQFGEMNIEVIIDPSGKPYIIELAARAGGNMIPVQLQDISGIDLVEALVLLTMGEPCPPVTFYKNDKVIAHIVLYSDRSGILRGVEYDPRLAPKVYREVMVAELGSHVDRFTYGSKSVGIAFVEFGSEAEMWDIVEHVSDYVHVLVDEDR